jgi:hypothetical protein
VTDTMDRASSELEVGQPSMEQLGVQLMDRAKDEGVSLVGPGGLLARADQDRAGVRVGRRAERAPWL